MPLQGKTFFGGGASWLPSGKEAAQAAAAAAGAAVATAEGAATASPGAPASFFWKMLCNEGLGLSPLLAASFFLSL